MMNHTGMICIFLAFLVESKASSLALRNLSCVTDYWNTISCSLKLPITSSGNTSYKLEIRKSDARYECELQRYREDQIASFTVPWIASVDKYSVTLINTENGKHNSFDSFHPVKNIKPKTPFNLTVQNANGTYSFFWKSGYENHIYRTVLPLTYEFLFYKDGLHDKVKVPQRVEMIKIETELDSNSTYTAMVRSEIKDEDDYGGTWSDWSSPVSWTTPYRASASGTDGPPMTGEHDSVGKIFIVMFLILGLVIVLISIGVARFKMNENAWVPTPATYFQPLFQNYQGDFQGWVLSKTPLQHIPVLEDFATIDKISEVVYSPAPEKTVIYSPAQGHPPYVGPTAELWAPCQMFDKHSETSVSCEEFPLFCDELPDKVDGLMQSVSVACLSEDVASLKDSALSLESLEDCEPCEEPVNIINPMPTCFKQDYCTLTDSPAGPVPTFRRDGNTS